MKYVSVYDGALSRVGVVETWISFVWQEAYADAGKFSLEVWHTQDMARLLVPGNFCGIDESDTLALITGVQVRKKKLVAVGTMASGLLARRVSTRRVYAENAEAAMRDVVSGIAPLERVALGESAGISAQFSAEIRDMSALDYCREIASACDIGFKLVHDKAANMLRFVCYRPGVNADARFATAFGNLGEIEYSASDADYKNVAAVVNKYTETVNNVSTEYRQVVYAGATGLTGYARREMIVTTSSRPEEGESESAFLARLKAEGEAALIEKNRIENVAFAIDDARVALGDIITAILPELHMALTVRVIGKTLTVQRNQTKREISIGTPIIRRG